VDKIGNRVVAACAKRSDRHRPPSQQELARLNSTLTQLTEKIAEALTKINAPGDPILQPSQDNKFGDYQCNAAMGLAKKLGKEPRDVAQDIIDNLDVTDLCETPEIAGPGFINLRLKPAFVATSLATIPPTPTTVTTPTDTDGAVIDRVGFDPVKNPEVVAVDLSSPNLAKEMHVGHLRSTVIGDCVARVLEFQGHTVHRENHVGDWGTQFGMLVAYLRHTQPDIIDDPDNLEIKDLESFYVAAKARFDADEDFKTESRETVVALQQGDPVIWKIWQAFCKESLRHCHEIYKLLKVELTDRGESFYAEGMEVVCKRLEKMRDSGENEAVRDSDGALCIFPGGFTTRDGEPLPMIVRKTDGGHNYATSDLATILHRVDKLGATRIVYVVGITQKQHFDMLFASVRKIGWVGENVRLEHLGFGSLLSKTGRPFKTREGGTVKLKTMLEEAIARARSVIDRSGDESKRDDSLSSEEMDRIATVVGLGAVKYFDLSHALASDYKFDLDHMLNLEGNTAPYMMYAYARVRSIGRKAEVDFTKLPVDAPIILDHPTELALAKKILRFAEILDTVARDLRPNVLTDYLYELSRTFSRFYDKKLGVRVINAESDELRISRLRLCDLTARVVKLGLHLLGIETIEKM
jgi:arginyl-tRNA synthetase